MKNKFGQTQSAYTLLCDAYERVLINMGRRQAISTGALLAAVMAAGGAPEAGATTYTWDTANNGATIDNGNGNWTTGTVWNSGSSNVVWPGTTTDDVVFGAGSVGTATNTVTLGANVGMNSLTFGAFTAGAAGSRKYTVTGDATAGAVTMTIGAGGLTDSSDGATIQNGTRTIGITLGAAQTWQQTVAGKTLTTTGITGGANLLTVTGAGNITVNGALSGTGGLTKSGSGTLTFNATGGSPVGTGALNVTGGTLLINNGGGANIQASTINITNATVTDRGNGGGSAHTISGLVTIGAGGLWNENNGAESRFSQQVTLNGGTLTASGAGVANPSSNDGYSVALNGGVKVIGTATATINGTSGVRLAQVGGTVFDVGVTGQAVDLDFSASMKGSGNSAVPVGGGLVKTGAGLLQIAGTAGTNSYRNLAVTAGAVQVAGGGYFEAGATVGLYTGTQLTFKSGGGFTGNWYTTDNTSVIRVTNGASVVRTGSDNATSTTLTLMTNAGSNIYGGTGSYQIDAASTLQYGNGGTTGTIGGGTVSLNATDAKLAFNYGGSGSTTVSNTITGTGQFIKSGSSTVVLTHMNLTGTGNDTGGTAGATTINGGTLALDYTLQNSSMLSDNASLILGGGTLKILNGDHAETVAGTAVGAGTANYILSAGRTLLDSTTAASATTDYIQLGNLVTSTGTLTLGSDYLGRVTTINGAAYTAGGQVNGVFIGVDQAKTDANGYLIANTNFTDVPYGGAIPDNPATADVRLTGGTYISNVTLAAATTNIGTLNNRQSNLDPSNNPANPTTVDMAGQTLRLGVGGAVTNGGLNSGLTIGTAANNGVLTAGGNTADTAGSITFNIQDAETVDPLATVGSNQVLVNSKITDNGAGAVNLIKSNTGTLVLAGDNTYTGSTLVSGGVLQVGNGGATGSLAAASVVTLAGSGTTADTGSATLRINRSGTSTFANTIASNTPAANNTVQISGTGNTTLSGNNTFQGTVVIDSTATLTVGSTTALGNANNTVTNNGGLVFAQNGIATVSSVISGTGFLRNGPPIAGTTTTVLGNANTYTGVTTIRGSTTNSILRVAKLDGINGASSLGTTDGSAAMLVIDGGTLQYTGAAVSVTRQYTLTTAGGKIDSSGSGAMAMANNVMTMSGSGTRTFRLGGTQTGLNLFQQAIVDAGGATSFAKEDSGTWYLTANNSYTGTTSNTGGSNSTGFGSGVTGAIGLIKRNAAVGGGTLLVGNGGTTGSLGSGSITNNSNLVYNRTDAGIFAQNISGTGAIGINRATTLTLSGSNGSFTGGTLVAAVSGSKIIANSITAFGANNDAYIASGATLDFNNNSFTLGGLNNSGAGGGTLTTGTGSLTVGGANNDGYFSGTITTTNGLAKIGNGCQTLASDQTFTGAVTVTNASGSGTGVLQLGAGGTTGNLLGGNPVTVNANTAIAFNRSDTFSFSNTISGAGGIVQNGTGTTVLTGTESYTGSVTVNRGTLQAGAGNTTAFGNGTTVVTMNGGTLDTNNTSYTLGGLAQGGSNVTTSNGLVVAGPTAAGTGELGGVGAAGTTGSIVALHANTLTLNLAASTAVAYGGTITGTSGSSLVVGSAATSDANRSTQILTGTNTYAGNTTVTGFTTLQLGDGQATTGGSIQSATVTLQDAGSNLTIARFGSMTLSSTITGAGSLTQYANANSARTTLTGTNTYTGATTASEGIIQVGNNGTTGSISGASAINITPVAGKTSAFEYNHSDATVLTNQITVTANGVGASSATLAFTGDGATTLRGVVSGTGTTRVSGGSGGTGGVVLDYAVGNTSRLSDNLQLSGGSITLEGGNYAQTMTSTTIDAGSSTQITQSGGTSTLHLGAVTMGAGANVGVSNQYVVQVTSGLTLNASSVLGGFTIGAGRSLATLSTASDPNGANWVIELAPPQYTNISYAGGGIDRPNPSVISDGALQEIRFSGNLYNAGSAGYITVANTANATVGGYTSVTTVDNILNRHLFTDPSTPSTAPGDTTVDLAAGQVLRVSSSGRIISGDDTGGLTLGSTANQGALTAGGTNNTAGTLSIEQYVNSANPYDAATRTGTRTLVNAKIVNNGTGAVNVSASGGGTITFAGDSTYTGTTQVGSNTTLQLGDGGTTGSIATGSAVTIANNGVLSFNRSDSKTIANSINVLSGNIGTIRQDGSGTTTYTGSSITGNVNTVVNNGTLVVSSGDFATGTSRVNNGTLVINTTHGVAGTLAGNYTVGDGVSGHTATLAGNGTINVGSGVNGGTVTVVGGGNITAGSNALSGTIGTLSLTTRTASIQGTYLVDLNMTAAASMGTAAGTMADYINVTGDVDLTGMTIGLRGSDTALPASGTHYAIKLLSWTGSDNGTAVADGANVTNLSGLTLRADQSIVRWGNAYYLVPEPASFALLGLGGLLLLRRPSRRRGRAQA